MVPAVSGDPGCIAHFSPTFRLYNANTETQLMSPPDQELISVNSSLTEGETHVANSLKKTKN